MRAKATLPKITIVLIGFFLRLQQIAKGHPDTSFVYSLCSNDEYKPSDSFEKGLGYVLSAIV
ncbi:hypothetical protein CDL15_Pgr018469 [Punica granatum]|uniref:Uncharacterized protein n=1 Tax=Punica granatum TaxID=22663 RepID=A0A218WZU9_PUNGR|nr:hypothetical protein CDL15_Pgr018469 [Punica granatum]